MNTAHSLTQVFTRFLDSEVVGGALLVGAAAIALAATNSAGGEAYVEFWHRELSALYLAGALTIWSLLIALNRCRVGALLPYLVGGILMWFLMLRSGVHPTLAGVLLAFAIPFEKRTHSEASPSHRLEVSLQRPVAYVVLPIFALANAAVLLTGDTASLLSNNSLGIFLGLLVGKPAGIVLASVASVTFGFCRLPTGLTWSHITGAGLLGGIGFTMSIFVTNLAFAGDTYLINSSKIAVLLASVTAGTLGLLWLKLTATGASEELGPSELGSKIRWPRR